MHNITVYTTSLALLVALPHFYSLKSLQSLLSVFLSLIKSMQCVPVRNTSFPVSYLHCYIALTFACVFQQRVAIVLFIPFQSFPSSYSSLPLQFLVAFLFLCPLLTLEPAGGGGARSRDFNIWNCIFTSFHPILRGILSRQSEWRVGYPLSRRAISQIRWTVSSRAGHNGRIHSAEYIIEREGERERELVLLTPRSVRMWSAATKTHPTLCSSSPPLAFIWCALLTTLASFAMGDIINSGRLWSSRESHTHIDTQT